MYNSMEKNPTIKDEFFDVLDLYESEHVKQF